jgi:hypothetical protein
LILNISQRKISEYYDVINQQKKKPNPKKIECRQKSKTCTIIKKKEKESPQYKKRTNIQRKIIKYDSIRSEYSCQHGHKTFRMYLVKISGT